MRNLLTVVLPLCLLFPACGENAAKAAETATSMLGDAQKQLASLDAAKPVVGDLMQTLSGITDGKSAEAAKASLEKLTIGLKEQLGSLGDLGKLSGTLATTKDSLLKPVLDKVAGLLGNAEVAKAIGPVLTQLKGLIGG
ncbi:MAG: hypothetical protein JNL08_09050 [Planctomycetes bacterium]|nr:hypothetical protein [Planctomycetota bacterium]